MHILFWGQKFLKEIWMEVKRVTCFRLCKIFVCDMNVEVRRSHFHFQFDLYKPDWRYTAVYNVYWKSLYTIAMLCEHMTGVSLWCIYLRDVFDFLLLLEAYMFSTGPTTWWKKTCSVNSDQQCEQCLLNITFGDLYVNLHNISFHVSSVKHLVHFIFEDWGIQSCVACCKDSVRWWLILNI